MSFQIHALPAAPFEKLFTLSDEELNKVQARRMVVDTRPGFPCRVSLADAEIGETVVLVNYTHQPHDTPYRASHAIFVRKGAAQAKPKPNEVPEVLTSRLLSVRAFDRGHQMINAEVVDGRSLSGLIDSWFSDPQIDYLHIHNARPGCFAASVTRLPEP